MPTGYTADVGNGKMTDFRTFALTCARNFGACITQRDDAMDVLPKHREESTYYAESLARDEQELVELLDMSEEQIAKAYEADYAHRLAEYLRYAEERRVTRTRYETMLAQVDAWEPPSEEHERLKQFMQQQITESIRFDCTGYGSEPERGDPQTWYQERLASVRRSISRGRVSLAEEKVRVAKANQWIDELYESLGGQVPRVT